MNERPLYYVAATLDRALGYETSAHDSCFERAYRATVRGEPTPDHLPVRETRIPYGKARAPHIGPVHAARLFHECGGVSQGARAAGLARSTFKDLLRRAGVPPLPAKGVPRRIALV